jgi:hypothetical protein
MVSNTNYTNKGAVVRETPNTFVRALIVGLVLALCCLSYINFFWREPQFEISAGLLSLIALIVLLSLSEIYDHLSFGAILTLKRKVEEERASKESLREDNRELRSHLVTLVANIQQSQVNNTFNAPPEVWGKLLGVVPASEPLAKEEEAPIPSAAVTQEDSSDTIRQSSRQRFERQRAAEGQLQYESISILYRLRTRSVYSMPSSHHPFKTLTR